MIHPHVPVYIASEDIMESSKGHFIQHGEYFLFGRKGYWERCMTSKEIRAAINPVVDSPVNFAVPIMFNVDGSEITMLGVYKMGEHICLHYASDNDYILVTKDGWKLLVENKTCTIDNIVEATIIGEQRTIRAIRRMTPLPFQRGFNKQDWKGYMKTYTLNAYTHASV